jgi:hypothetical protein
VAARFRVGPLARETVDHVRRYFAPGRDAPPRAASPGPAPGADRAAPRDASPAPSSASGAGSKGDAVPGRTASAFRLEHAYRSARGGGRGDGGDDDDGRGPSCGLRRFLVVATAYRMLTEGAVSSSMREVLERGGPLAADLAEAVLELCVVGGRDPREVKAETWHDLY